ncbi:MAG: hypothetical protein P0107_07305, partial [Nitrosomonas sp.]|nr:hypothetical protein [Nitrosomonas sp.]
AEEILKGEGHSGFALIHGMKSPHGDERILRVSNHEALSILILRDARHSRRSPRKLGYVARSSG